jgi:hypothetical protein
MRLLPRTGPWPLRVALAAAAVALFFTGQALRGGGASQPTGRVLEAGALRVGFGPDWFAAEPDARTGWSRINRFDGSWAEAGALAGGAGPGTLLGGRAAGPQRVRLGAAPALLYRRGRASAYVFTLRSGGRVALVCSRSCKELTARTAVDGAIDGDRRPQIAARLQRALGNVAAAWPAARRQLAARAPGARAAGARSLAQAYRGLAAAARGAGLGPVAARAGAAAGDFAALARSTRGSRAAELAAARLAQRDETALRGAVEALSAQGYAIGGAA